MDELEKSLKIITEENNNSRGLLTAQISNGKHFH
jgi:hypothetical protein